MMLMMENASMASIRRNIDKVPSSQPPSRSERLLGWWEKREELSKADSFFHYDDRINVRNSLEILVGTVLGDSTTSRFEEELLEKEGSAPPPPAHAFPCYKKLKQQEKDVACENPSLERSLRRRR